MPGMNAKWKPALKKAAEIVVAAGVAFGGLIAWSYEWGEREGNAGARLERLERDVEGLSDVRERLSAVERQQETILGLVQDLHRALLPKPPSGG